MDTYVAGAYWPARREGLESSTSRALRFFNKLNSVGPEFSGWRGLGRNRKSAQAQPVLDINSYEDIAARLEKGRNRYDVPPRDVIEELGYSLGLWNGQLENRESLSLSIHCGDYSNCNPNSVVMSPLLCLDVTSREQISLLIDSFVTAWTPEFCIFTRRSRLDEESEMARKESRQRGPFLDIALYLSEELLPRYTPQQYLSSQDIHSGRIFLNV